MRLGDDVVAVFLIACLAPACGGPTEPLPGEGEDEGKTVVYRDTDQTTFNSEIPSAALAPAFICDPYAVIPINGGMRIVVANGGYDE